MQAIRSVHTRIEPAGQGIGEAWAIFTENRQLLKLRMDFPPTEDGPKVTLWEKDRAGVWFRRKNSVVTVTERAILDRLSGFFDMIDPKPQVDLLLKAQGQHDQGNAQVSVQEPAKPGDPITITLVPQGEQRQMVFLVDAKSHLVERIGTYSLKDGNPWLRQTLCQCALAAGRTKRSYYCAQYRRLSARRGRKRAALAVAHSQLVTIYHLLQGSPYRDLGADYFEKLAPQRLTHSLVARLERLGYKVTLEEKPAA